MTFMNSLILTIHEFFPALMGSRSIDGLSFPVGINKIKYSQKFVFDI